MTDDRRDPEIVVFGIEDDVWADSSPSAGFGRTAGPGNSPDDRGSAGPGDDLPDEIRQGDDPDRQRRPILPGVVRLRDRIVLRGRQLPPRQVAIALVSLVVVAFVAGVLVGRRSSHQVAAQGDVTFVPFSEGQTFAAPRFRLRFSVPDPPSSSSSPGPRVTVASSQVYAMQLEATPENQAHQSQETRDGGATTGPWSVIVRRSDGSLGQHGAVITYPVPAVTTGPVIRVGGAAHPVALPNTSCVGRTVAECRRVFAAGVIGHVDEAGGIVWPVDGKFARIRGDLGRSTLATLAARVSIRNGHPAVTHLATGYRVIVSEPYRAPVVTQSRYTDSLRVDSGPIDGLIYSEVVLGGASFEEALYSEDTVPGGDISGHPAIRSPVGGGSATLAWEVAPGIVALVGYSGGLVPSAALPSLTELALGGHLLGRAQWTATHPSMNRGDNYYS